MSFTTQMNKDGTFSCTHVIELNESRQARAIAEATTAEEAEAQSMRLLVKGIARLAA